MLKRPTHRMILGPVEPKEADAFWSALEKSGATSSISVGEYVTVAELTGSGFLFNVVTPTFTATFAPVVRPARD